MAANLAGVRQAVQASDLPLALDPRRVSCWEVPDQSTDPLAKLQSEVGGGGAHQLPDIIDSHLATFPKPVWVLGLAHPQGVLPVLLTGCGSRSESTLAWTPTEIALESPITQPWL